MHFVAPSGNPAPLTVMVGIEKINDDDDDKAVIASDNHLITIPASSGHRPFPDCPLGRTVF